jgi:hypothetical protein
MRAMLPIHKLPEILVRGDQDAFLFVGKVHDLGIGQPGHTLGNIDDIV